jgi:hypothetical protein
MILLNCLELDILPLLLFIMTYTNDILPLTET